MKKIIFAFTLLAMSASANAIQVTLLAYQTTSDTSGVINTSITDGSHISGILGPTTAIFDWDGTTLTSTGTFTAVNALGGSPFSPTVIGEQITNLTIDTTGTGSAGGTSAYTCIEGTFVPSVGGNFCGGYTFGANFLDESTTVWGPGLSVSQTLGGDDVVAFGGPRTISEYDFGTITLISGSNTLAPGTIFSIGNGIGVGNPGGDALTFQVVPVPAAVWLFGSALGLLGWARRKST